MKFAAIDIGSNAVRLLLTRVIENNGQNLFKKESLIRIPIRLGIDSFTKTKISEEKITRLISTMKGFKNLIEAYQPIEFRACATAAMREAQNKNEIVKAIKEESDIDVEIIDGRREAEIIFANHIEKSLTKENAYLYIDVGGGSTELTLFSEKESIASKSFDIGTIRILKNLVSRENWDSMKQWVKKNVKKTNPTSAIGSGGNINKIFRISRKKEGKPISKKNMKKIYDFLKSYTWEERINVLKLRPDRADVIIPASKIYISIMKWAKIDKMYVPQIGLSDGLIHIMYDKHKQKTCSKEGVHG